MNKFTIGTIVVAKVHPNLVEANENEYIYYNNRIESVVEDVPIMVINEINCTPKPENKYNPQFGDTIGAIKDEKKYLCAWYDHELGIFKDKLFYKNQILVIPIKGYKYSESNLPKIGTKVYLSTNKIEAFKVYSDKNKTFRFKSPLLVIIDYKRIEEPIKFDSKKGKPIKSCDVINAKCQWFNYKSGKYSEEWLPLSALCSHNFTDEIPFNFLKKEEIEICKTIGNGSSLIPTMKVVERELEITESNGFSQQRQIGKLFEWKALQSNDEIVLNPELYSFFREQKWSCIQNKIFICDEEKYGQIDILAQYNEQKIIVDIIRSSTIDEAIAKKWANNENSTSEETKALDKYWSRIIKYKEILNIKYNKAITSCYLLVDYQKKDEFEMFITQKN